MNVDIAALRAIERDKEIPFDTVLEAIETALLTAYRHTDGHQPHARIDIDRKSGLVRVHGAGARRGRGRRHASGTTRPRASAASPPPPRGRSSCSACVTPSTSARSASSPPRKARSSRASSSATRAPTPAVSSWSRCRARSRACCRRPSRCPARPTLHGERIRCYVVGVTRGMRGTQITLSRTHPGLVRKLFALEVPGAGRRLGRDRGRRPRVGPPVQDRGAVDGVGRQPEGRVHRADGRTGARRDERAERREDRHHRLVGRSGDVRRQRPLAVEGGVGHRARRDAPARRASSCPTSSCRWPSARKARTPGWRPASPAGASTSAATPIPRSASGAPESESVG